MAPTYTVTADCTACGACLATCPTRAFQVVRGRPPLVVIAERCTGCAACAEICPASACVPRTCGGLRPPDRGTDAWVEVAS